VAEAVP